MNNYTIAEKYSLPSKALIYNVEFDPEVTIKSMTTRQELQRLASNKSAYKMYADLIQECIVEKLPISVYDMCLGDYEFLLHKLRIVSYSSDYKTQLKCPYCDNVIESNINLSSLDVSELDNADEFEKLLTITLPKSNKIVKLRYTTPRMLDEISDKAKEELKKNKDKENVDIYDYNSLFRLMAHIENVDNQKLDRKSLEQFILSLPVSDSLIIENRIEEIDRFIGVDVRTTVTCPDCEAEIPTFFRFGPEFFRPTL